jgi:hypothetical protein
MTADVEAIAKGLTPTQRNAIKLSLPTPSGHFVLRKERTSWKVIKHLYWNDLLDGGYVLSPLGVAVRNRLKGQQ